MNNVVFAFTLTMIAGLSTGIGSCIAFFAKKANKKFLSVSLGFSAGVMIYVSMVEMFFKARSLLSASFGESKGVLITNISFFSGMILIALLDKILPEDKSDIRKNKSNNVNNNEKKLMRTGLVTALAIGIHNLPEGLATFVSSLQDATLAIPIMVAISIHNIPEGIAVSVPIYYATGSKKKAFIYSFLSGLTEPLGALLGYLILMPIMSDTVYGILFAAVSGIMVFISVDELLPSAREYESSHVSIYGLVVGMIVMALSIWLFI